jgi:hypothetical protein
MTLIKKFLGFTHQLNKRGSLSSDELERFENEFKSRITKVEKILEDMKISTIKLKFNLGNRNFSDWAQIFKIKGQYHSLVKNFGDQLYIGEQYDILETTSFEEALNHIKQNLKTQSCLKKILSEKLHFTFYKDLVLCKELLEDYSVFKADGEINWPRLEMMLEDEFNNSSGYFEVLQKDLAFLYR